MNIPLFIFGLFLFLVAIYLIYSGMMNWALKKYIENTTLVKDFAPYLNCSKCKTGILIERLGEVHYSYKGQQTFFKNVRGKYCTSCGGMTLNQSQAEDYLELVRAFKKLIDATESKSN